MKWYWGAAALVAGAGIGAGIGALARPEDFTGNPSRQFGAAVGASTGLLLVGIAGVGALLAPETRAAGLTASLPVAALVVAGSVAHAAG